MGGSDNSHLIESAGQLQAGGPAGLHVPNGQDSPAPPVSPLPRSRAHLAEKLDLSHQLEELTPAGERLLSWPCHCAVTCASSPARHMASLRSLCCCRRRSGQGPTALARIQRCANPFATTPTLRSVPLPCPSRSGPHGPCKKLRGKLSPKKRLRFDPSVMACLWIAFSLR